jgi:hypothetical protein
VGDERRAQQYQVEVERDSVVLFIMQDQMAVTADNTHHGIGTILTL